MSTLIMITLAITIGCNLIAGVASYLVLYTNVFESRRIQRRRYRSDIFRERLPLIAFNLGVLVILTCVGLHFAEGIFSWAYQDLGWTGWFGVCAQVAFLMIIDDAYFYVFHRNLHERPWLYRTIHKIHHKAFVPFPLEYIYVHPLEWMIGAGAIPIGLYMIYLTQGSVSVWAFWIFAAWRNLHEVDIHSGLKPKWTKKIPLLGTSEHHDLHHMRNSKGNYSSTFTFWDRVFGTTLTPKIRKDRKHSAS